MHTHKEAYYGLMMAGIEGSLPMVPRVALLVCVSHSRYRQ